MGFSVQDLDIFKSYSQASEAQSPQSAITYHGVNPKPSLKLRV